MRYQLQKSIILSERERDRLQCRFIDFGIYSFTNVYLEINGRDCTVVTDHTPSSFQPYIGFKKTIVPKLAAAKMQCWATILL